MSRWIILTQSPGFWLTEVPGASAEEWTRKLENKGAVRSSTPPQLWTSANLADQGKDAVYLDSITR